MSANVPCIPVGVVLTSRDRPEMRLDAEMLSLGEHTIELLSPICLPAGINVDVIFGHDATINTRVSGCTPEQDTHVLHLTMNADRRKHARVEVQQPAVIRIADDPNASAQSGTIVNVSPGGLGMQLEQAVPKGTRVEITVPGAVVYGAVRHCSLKQGRYHIGIAMQSVTRGVRAFDVPV